MKVIFYISSSNPVNDATIEYLKIINEALSDNKEMSIVSKLKKIPNNSFVITYTVTDFFRVKARRPNLLIANWFQGIIPEEAALKEQSKFRRVIYYYLEKFALRTSNFNFFVSKAMQKHYLKKYNYKKDNFFIMPCFNSSLQKRIKNKHFSEPSFVYIGSMAKWQCIDLTLNVFKSLKKEIPDAKLTLLTSQKEIARERVEQLGLKEVCIKYVRLEDISAELLKYKYGFLIRENIPVNNVSTPTKMSTYLASGVVPIFSNYIHDFRDSFSKLKFKIMLESNSTEAIAKKIIDFDNTTKVNSEEIMNEFKTVFDSYYKKDQYIRLLRKVPILKEKKIFE